MRTEDLSEKQKNKSLALLMFLKEKRDISIKGCGLAVGKKKENIESKDATSTTVLAESVMLTATIDALKGRDVAMLEIPGAYLSADMDDELHMVLRGTLTELMVTDNP